MPIEMNGVQAWITVDNKVQLVEYEVGLDLSSNTATCWISGEPGQVCTRFITARPSLWFNPRIRKRSS